jgi:hypothetical protein
VPPFEILYRSIGFFRQKGIRRALIERAPNSSRPLGLEAIAEPTLRVRSECPTGFLWKTWTEDSESSGVIFGPFSLPARLLMNVCARPRADGLSENQWERLSNRNSPLAHKNLRSLLTLPRELCKKISLLGPRVQQPSDFAGSRFRPEPSRDRRYCFAPQNRPG